MHTVCEKKWKVTILMYSTEIGVVKMTNIISNRIYINSLYSMLFYASLGDVISPCGLVQMMCILCKNALYSRTKCDFNINNTFA